jgi:hypothetical protein
MPFLEILTRAYKRPLMLNRNKASVQALGKDVLHTVLHDSVGRGIGWSYRSLAAYARYLAGNYIWILDDDDECIHPTLVDELKQIVIQCAPDVIMVRMDHGEPLGILPSLYWQHPPVQGQIGCSAFIVRRKVWQKHADAMQSGHYASDFDFISAIFASDPEIYWHDVVASRCQRSLSNGAPE